MDNLSLSDQFVTPHSFGADKRKWVLITLFIMTAIVIGLILYFVYFSSRSNESLIVQEVPLSQIEKSSLVNNLQDRRAEISNSEKESMLMGIHNRNNGTLEASEKAAIIKSLSNQ